MNDKLLSWRLSPSGDINIASSSVRDAQHPGEAGELTWYIGGRDDHWGVALSGQQGQVWHQHVIGPLDDAKAVAEAYEEENYDTDVTFALVDVLERYYLVGGAFVTRRATTIPTPMHIGELNGNYTEPVAKQLRKARRDNKVLRIITLDGIAVIPATQITHVVVLQRWQNTGEEFLGEPGYPQHVHDSLAAEDAGNAALVDQLMDLADVYAAAQVEEANTTAGMAESKAAEAAREHLRGHIVELVEHDDHDH